MLQTKVFNTAQFHWSINGGGVGLDAKARQYSDDTPLRLDVAVKAAFPAGGITVAGLRKEIAKGRLEVELIAGKLFTTLGAIARMRERCRVVPKNLVVDHRNDLLAAPLDDAEIAQAKLHDLVTSRLRSVAARKHLQSSKSKKVISTNRENAAEQAVNQSLHQSLHRKK